MSIASRKEREFNERERLIIETSFEMLLEHGYIGFTIDKLAKKIDYAKGTVYKHFACKEDIIVRIINEGFAHRQTIIARSFTLDLPERALFLAASLGARLYNKLNPNFSKLKTVACVGSIWEKVSDELKEKHDEMTRDSYEGFDGLLQLAVKNGNLELNEHDSYDIFYTLISLCVSYDGLIKDKKYSDMPPSLFECFESSNLIKNPSRVLSLNLNTYMDGLGWKPLSSEYDYYALEEEMRSTIYADLVELDKKGIIGGFDLENI